MPYLTSSYIRSNWENQHQSYLSTLIKSVRNAFNYVPSITKKIAQSNLSKTISKFIIDSAQFRTIE